MFASSIVVGLQSRSQQLVLRGDYPDPSVIKIGAKYWASATTSNWMPAYPLLYSEDLVNWKNAGSVFPTLPEWADYYFWAPEISYENGKVYIYYSAHKKGGNLCVGIASADKPEGPYTDHGALICEAAGSIDAFPMRDEKGKLHLIWKEDGNSIKQPTPIWIQELNEQRTALIGEKKELFRNDADWEANLVEGVSMMRKGDYFYAFYAAAACCGSGCTYKTGIARAKSLMGPWEKYARNPVLENEGEWKCPGHGTPVEKNGRYYFMYHAYDTIGSVYTGRQGLIREFKFTSDGWIEFMKEEKQDMQLPHGKNEDEFKESRLSNEWQWSVFQNFNRTLSGGKLAVSALPQSSGAMLAKKTYHTNYTAVVEIDRKKSSAEAGLALIGDEKNLVCASIKGNTLQIVTLNDGNETVVSSHPLPARKKAHLSMTVRNGKDITFSYGRREKDLTPLNTKSIDGTFLPPWDRALRVGILSKGSTTEKAVFDEFSVRYQ
jgi:beta-xylosidase